MKSPAPAVDKRAPLSQYLRAEDEDGWTIFSSDDARTDLELAPRSERNPDLSVLKQIKNFLSGEASQDGSFFSNDESGDSHSFRVDYPFYDSNLEDDAFDETPRREKLVVKQEPEPTDVPASEREQLATSEFTESDQIKPQKSSDEDKSTKKEAFVPDKSSQESTSNVILAPKNQTPCGSNETSSTSPSEEIEISNDSFEASTTLEQQEADSSKVENVLENNEEFEVASYENALEELVATPCENETAEIASDESSSVQESKNEVEVDVEVESQSYVVDFSETLAPVLERRARGEELEEPPLVQTTARRSKRVKKETTVVTATESSEPDKSQFDASKEQTEEIQFERSRYVGDGRMAIFRRYVDLVSQSAEKPNDSESENIQSEPSAFESKESSELEPCNETFDYGESTSYVVAPCFGDFASVTSFASASTFSPLTR